MDIFDTKNLKPMLISEMKDAFDSPDWIYEIKFDGIRSIAYCDSSGVDIRNKREKKLLPHLPELTDLYKQVKNKCILDGEVFVLKNGVTDFYEIQTRVMTTNLFKMQLASGKYPACFVVFDILYYRDKLITDYPLMDRKKLLEEVVQENQFISVSRFIETNGIQLYEAAKAQGLEGIVAKRKDSRYYFDKRTRDWIKCKVMLTDDYIICGYILKENNMTSLILGQYDNGELVYKGHVTLGVSLRILNQHPYQMILSCPFGSVPAGNENAVWMVPELVCIVESMPTDKQGFRQPVFKGIRDDKPAEDCIMKKSKDDMK